MRFGIRYKLALLLSVVALLPLAAATLTIAVGLGRIRSATVGQTVLTTAVAESLGRQVALQKDVLRLLAVADGDQVAEMLKKRTTRLSDEELRRLDKIWPVIPLDQEPMSLVLNNPVSAILGKMVQADPTLKEVSVADRFGQLVAANERTNDYYQADETWWQEAYFEGKGRIFISVLSFDETAHVSPLQIAVPVIRDGQVLGVILGVFDAQAWISAAGGAEVQDTLSVMLLASDGKVLLRPQGGTPQEYVPKWRELTSPREKHYVQTEDSVVAVSPIKLPDRITDLPVKTPVWYLGASIPKSRVTGPVASLIAMTFAMGLLVVVGFFLLGLWLIDRSLLRRILRVDSAALQVSRGNLDLRVTLPPSGTLGRDEIDQLADSFNKMIENVQKSTGELVSANELKTNFIRVAGHELRTPVSYILGMARLLKDNADPMRLQFGVQSMGAKAQRLNEIIQAMFKLMPGQLHREDMHYSDVNFSELAEEIYIDVFPFVEKRNQRLIIEVLDTLPPIKADRDKLRDMIENLVMNAIKFTPDGGIVKVRASLALGERVTISVQDQGPGISESEYPKLFQPFYAGAGADVMTHSTGELGYQKRGIGLGLAIVRHFAELHHGSVHVSSSPLGSTFSVTIPINPSPEDVEPPEGSESPQAPQAPPQEDGRYSESSGI